MRPHQKLYLIEVAPALVLYVLAVLVLPLAQPHATAAWQRIALALVPLLAIVWVIVALWRRLLRKDELEQRIELIAIAIASSIVGIASLAWGMLELDGLAPPISLFYVLPALVGTYGAIKCVAWWRYR
jgi:hypothetical protein